MKEFVFVLKCLIASLVLVTLMQIRYGGTTLENHAHNAIQNSAVTEFMQGTAAGAIVLATDGFEKIKDLTSRGVEAAKNYQKN